jgi:hypothetical protein
MAQAEIHFKFTFDEPLDPTSVNSTNIVVQEVGVGNRQLTFQYFLVNGQGGINIYPQGGLKPGRTYKIRISGVKDASGNAIPSSNPIWTFSIAPLDFQSTTIEDFGSSVASWYQPSGSGSTVGVETAAFERDSSIIFSLMPAGAASGRLTYDWNLLSTNGWLIREYLNSGPGRSVTFTKTGHGSRRTFSGMEAERCFVLPLTIASTLSRAETLRTTKSVCGPPSTGWAGD